MDPYFLCFVASHIYPENEFQVDHLEKLLVNLQKCGFHKVIISVSFISHEASSQIEKLQIKFSEVEWISYPNAQLSQFRHINIYFQSLTLLKENMWVTFMDDDDLLHHHFLPTISKVIQENPNIEALMVPIEYFLCHDESKLEFDGHDTRMDGSDHPGTTCKLSFLQQLALPQMSDQLDNPMCDRVFASIAYQLGDHFYNHHKFNQSFVFKRLGPCNHQKTNWMKEMRKLLNRDN